MKIGLLLPNLLMAERFEDRVFAPKELALAVGNELVARGHEVYVYAPEHTITNGHLVSFPTELENREFPSQKDLLKSEDIRTQITYSRNQNEYEVFVTARAVEDANNRKLDILHNYIDMFGHYFVPFATMPTLFTIHDPVFDPISLESFRFSTFKNHHYLAISNYQKQRYKEVFQLSSISTIHHGVSLSDFSFSEEADEYLCSIGRYLPAKGIDDALLIASELKKNIVISSGANFKHTDYYKKSIEPFIHSPYVKEVDFMLPPERNRVFSRTKAFLFPIKWEEAFGMVLIEAMACGTPVIAYARGSTPEIIEDGKTGYLVNSSDTDIRGDWLVKKTGLEGLREAVGKIYGLSQEQYKEMRKQCHHHVEKHFSIQRMAEDYEKLYLKIVGSNI